MNSMWQLGRKCFRDVSVIYVHVWNGLRYRKRRELLRNGK